MSGLTGFGPPIITMDGGNGGAVSVTLQDSTPANYPIHAMLKKGTDTVIEVLNDEEPTINISGIPVGSYELVLVTADGIPLGTPVVINSDPNQRIIGDTLYIKYPTPGQ